MDQEVFARYAQIKKQMSELEDQLNELKPEIAAELKQLPDSKLKTPFGVFSIQKRAKWTYSEIVQDLEGQLKVRQKEEQEDGIAKAEYTESVYFKGAAAAASASA